VTDFKRGQKSKLTDLVEGTGAVVKLDTASPGMTIDFACFGLDSSDKLSDDRYMVFFNQLATPCGAVQLNLRDGAATFATDVAKLPGTISRLVFVASMDGAGTMRDLGPSTLTVGSGVFRFQGSDFAGEKAVIIGEIYQRDGVWRFGAVGQGFAGGLGALLAHFGGEEAPPEAPAKPATVAPPAKVNMSKVTLTKPGQTHKVSLIKGASAPQKLIVKATWVDNGDNNANNDDLDLRVGLLLPDGRMKLISAPSKPGSFDADPFIRHTGDVRVATLTEPGTETVEVNPRISEYNNGPVVLVFSVYSAIGNGAVSVASLQPKMRMEYGDQVVECAFDFTTSEGVANLPVYTYVIGTALIDGDSITLAPSGRTAAPSSENTPWLKWSGKKFTMTLDGPAVFKGKLMTKLFGMSKYKYS
jgi:tellurite resistance protein TerA